VSSSISVIAMPKRLLALGALLSTTSITWARGQHGGLPFGSVFEAILGLAMAVGLVWLCIDWLRSKK